MPWHVLQVDSLGLYMACAVVQSTRLAMARCHRGYWGCSAPLCVLGVKRCCATAAAWVAGGAPTMVPIPSVSIERLCIVAWALGALSCFGATRVLPTGRSTLSTHLWFVGTEQPRIAVTFHIAHFICQRNLGPYRAGWCLDLNRSFRTAGAVNWGSCDGRFSKQRLFGSFASSRHLHI